MKSLQLAPAVIGLAFVENVLDAQRGRVLGAQNALMTLVPAGGIGLASVLIELGGLPLATAVLAGLWILAALAALLSGVIAAREGAGARPPVFVKIAPDMDDTALTELAAVVLDSGVDGLIATNTTLSRAGLTGAHARETGGLSGAPLFDRSTRVLARLHLLTRGRLPIIGVGGIGSPQQAWDKIAAGATAVQIYSALIYQGLSLAPRIARELDRMAEDAGLAHLSDLAGRDAERWAAMPAA